MKEFVRLRNEQQRVEFARPTLELFHDVPASSKSTMQRRSAAMISELRQQPATVIMTVLGFDGRHPVDVRMLRPVNAPGDTSVLLGAEALDHALGFIRHSGITSESLAKRPYKSFERNRCQNVFGDVARCSVS